MGVQIHHISPIKNRYDVVGILDLQGIVEFGKYFNSGEYSTHKIITVGGSSAVKPAHYKILKGTSIKDIFDSEIDDTGIRIISGDVLSGVTSTINNSLCFYHHQLTLIPEECKREFLGWAMPGIKNIHYLGLFYHLCLPKRIENFQPV